MATKKYKKGIPTSKLLLILGLAIVFMLTSWSFYNRFKNSPSPKPSSSKSFPIPENKYINILQDLPEVQEYVKLVKENGYQVVYDVTDWSACSGSECIVVFIDVYELRDTHRTRFNSYMIREEGETVTIFKEDYPTGKFVEIKVDG